MSHLAEVHYRQARSFMRAGDPRRAVELLEKARVLARNERDLLTRVLEELVSAYEATGQHDKAGAWREQLNRLVPAPPPAPRSFAPLNPTRPRRWRLPLTVAASLLIGGAAAFLALRFWPGGQTSSANVSARATTTTTATAVAARPTTALASATPTTAIAAPTTTATTAPPATRAVALDEKIDRQQLLKENVGLVIVILRYEGTANRRQMRIDVPLGMGTAFAVHPTGVLLTNKHVVEAGKPADIPVTLEDAGMPTVTLRSTTYMVCFGPTAADRFPAKLVHKSDKFDVAVLKVNHPFINPLALAARPLRQGEDILCCGFPGAITQALNQAAATPRKVVEVSRKWQQTGYVDPFDQFSPDSFNSTLTRGIVSAPERNVRGVSYLQMDAAISPGNSGGPVLNALNEVVGIATFGLRNDAVPLNNYNFALLLDQVRTEIDPFMNGN